MGGIVQFATLVLIAALIVATVLLLAWLTSRLFTSRVIRKRIFTSAIAICVLGVISYFGFIAFLLSGNLN